MKFVIRSILVLLYPLLLLDRLLNALVGRDPLCLREPKGETCWIVREPAAVNRTSYFSESSETEGRGHGGFGMLATVALGWVARLLAPPRPQIGEDSLAAADRDQDIPDEVYTLW